MVCSGAISAKALEEPAVALFLGAGVGSEAGALLALDACADSRQVSDRRAGLRAKALRFAAAALIGVLGAPVSLSGARWAAEGRPPWARPLDSVGLAGHNITKDIAEVQCAVDVSSAVLRLSTMAVQIRWSVKKCKDVAEANDNAKAVCAARVLGSIQNALFVAVSVSGAVSSCADTINVNATCASGITQFLAAVSVMSTCAAEATQVCSLWWNSVPVPPNGVTTPFPYLPTTKQPTPRPTLPAPTLPPLPVPTLVPAILESKNSDVKSDFETFMVNCVNSVGLGVTFLFRAAISIVDATLKCTPEYFAQNRNDSKGQKRCAIDIIGLIGVLNQAARFLSLAVPNCAGEPYFGGYGDGNAAGCAAAIAGMVGSVFVGTAPAMQFRSICNPFNNGLGFGKLAKPGDN